MERIFGSCRVSTKKQNIDRQERNILARYPNAIIYKDYYTGTRVSGRTGLEKILSQVQSGDTIVFDSVSRMSRNADEGIKLYFELYDKGVSLVFINEPHINTDTYRSAMSQEIKVDGGDETLKPLIDGINGFLKALAKQQIRLAFEQSQKEVNDLRERTRQGIETARRNGKQIGQREGRVLNVKKRAPAKQKILSCSKDFNGMLGDDDVIRLCGISRKTYYKYKSELRLGIMD